MSQAFRRSLLGSPRAVCFGLKDVLFKENTNGFLQAGEREKGASLRSQAAPSEPRPSAETAALSRKAGGEAGGKAGGEGGGEGKAEGLGLRAWSSIPANINIH